MYIQYTWNVIQLAPGTARARRPDGNRERENISYNHNIDHTSNTPYNILAVTSNSIHSTTYKYIKVFDDAKCIVFICIAMHMTVA